MRWTGLGAVITGFLLVMSGSAEAQQQASIIGTISDATKALLPGATVTATNVANGTIASGVSDERGEYRLLNLTPGRYKLQAELSGFTTVVIPEIELLVGQTATVPFSLSLASVSETLTVTGEAPLVNTASSQVAGNVNPRQMDAIPLQGRNWLELAKLVKGITANDISNNPGVAEDFFQLNLDGQQVTQKIAGSSFGQPRFSRDSIAEFQIVTNLFEITQGRSAGLQVQAISRSGTNNLAGSFYGYFRDNKFNSADAITGTVLPYENQQVGGTFGGPIIKNKLHYFASYEYEREPGTVVGAPAALPGQIFTTPYKNAQKSLLARTDWQASMKDRVTGRGTWWDLANPFVGANHPSQSTNQTKSAYNLLGSWTRVLSDKKVQEVRLGFNNAQWGTTQQDPVGFSYEYRFPGLTVGKPYNLPQWLYQNNFESRYDLSWHHEAHDFKIGGEYIYAHTTALWYDVREGIFTFTAIPADIATRITVTAPYDASKWNFAGLENTIQRFERNFNHADWTLDVPQPTWGIWFGDTWRMRNDLSVNYGIRWDVNWNIQSTPDVVTNVILVDTGVGNRDNIPEQGKGDYGYKKDFRSLKDVAPRAGFTWNVGGGNTTVIRGGSGIFYANPFSSITYQPQLFSRMVTGYFPYDGQPGFLTDPTRGITTYDQALAAAPPQAGSIVSPNFKAPYTWQSSIGIQKQINNVTGFDVDLVHYNEYRDTKSFDPNLFYDPATGYNKNPAQGRPNPAWGQIVYFVSTGQRDYTALTSAFNRRLRNHVQGGVTHTLMLAMHDDGGFNYTNPSANNQFDYIDGEWATSTNFQRNTVRVWGLVSLPFGISTSVAYAYGSGNRYADTISTAPYGKPGQNRLNLSASGGASPAITVPAGVLDRWDGPAVVASGAIIPRNALAGLPVQRFDVRLTKELRFSGTGKVELMGEVFNLFNHKNYSGYFTQLNPTNAATTARFGLPSAASIPRQGQLGFRFSW
jgi:carboxypeptidase family protein